MPTVTITWDDINDNEDGFNIYRDTVPLDTANPENLPVPLDTVAAGIGTYDDTTAAEDTTYYYAVAAVKGSFINAADEVEVATAPPVTIDTATVGDEVEGGIYAGQITYGDGRQFHLLFAKQAGEVTGAAWGNSGVVTGATETYDGKANQELILSSFDDGSAAAFYHCRDYVDAGGNGDYYLPARNELALVDALVGMSHAEFSTDLSTYRWSSTEYASSTAWSRRFADGDESGYFKNNTSRRVRPVRRVAVDPDYSTLAIGDEAGGGIYAGIDTIDGVDYYIVAGLAESEEYGLPWKTSRTTTAGTGSETDGLANTLAMEAAGLADHPAAAHCLAYAGGGRSDWHMPARSQLTLMYNNLAGHAEFAANVSSGDYTWASTEYSSFNACDRRFSDGFEINGIKDNASRWVRPIRRIPVNP